MLQEIIVLEYGIHSCCNEKILPKAYKMDNDRTDYATATGL